MDTFVHLAWVAAQYPTRVAAQLPSPGNSQTTPTCVAAQLPHLGGRPTTPTRVAAQPRWAVSTSNRIHELLYVVDWFTRFLWQA